MYETVKFQITHERTLWIHRVKKFPPQDVNQPHPISTHYNLKMFGLKIRANRLFSSLTELQVVERVFHLEVNMSDTYQRETIHTRSLRSGNKIQIDWKELQLWSTGENRHWIARTTADSGFKTCKMNSWNKATEQSN